MVHSSVYLVGNIPLILIWLFIFLKRKDIRTEMIWIGIFVAVAGLAAQYFWWTHDWWHPPTITHTRVGIEDILLGFFSGGIITGACELIHKEKLIKIKHVHIIASMVLVGLMLLGMFMFDRAGINSFLSTSVVLVIGTIYILFDRPDLIKHSLWSGFLILLCAIPAYAIPYLIWPHSDLVQNIWYMKNLTGIFLLGVPLEDYVFWLTAGFFVGPFYEWQKGYRLRVGVKK